MFQKAGRYLIKSSYDWALCFVRITAYNILARYSLVDAEKKMVKEYKSFERDKPDELVQADLTRMDYHY